MVIVRLTGRLGNQMFQYALARSLQSQGKEIYIDSSMLKYDDNHYELGIYSGCSAIGEVTEKDKDRLGDCRKDLVAKVKRKVLGYKKTHVVENGYQYHPEIFELNQVYLEGYWQSEKYFKKIGQLIRSDFTFPEIKEKNNLALAEQIARGQSVSLHIRRGDYLEKKYAPMHGNICNKKYYDNAIAYIRTRVEQPLFYVFTDDVQWAKEQYKEQPDFIIIDGNNGDKSFRDMQLMSMCKHHIIANSSFSWWGAWLDKNPEKIVVAPPKWFNLADTPDIWCEGWERVENE